MSDESDCSDEESEVCDIIPKRYISKANDQHCCTLCHSKVMVGAGTANFDYFDNDRQREMFLMICRKCSIAISLCAC